MTIEDEWMELAGPALDAQDPEFSEIRSAVREGLEQTDRGEGESAAQFFAELRAEHGL